MYAKGISIAHNSNKKVVRDQSALQTFYINRVWQIALNSFANDKAVSTPSVQSTKHVVDTSGILKRNNDQFAGTTIVLYQSIPALYEKFAGLRAAVCYFSCSIENINNICDYIGNGGETQVFDFKTDEKTD